MPFMQRVLAHDTVLHAIVYGIFCFFLLRAFCEARWSLCTARVHMYALIATVTYGLLVECMQGFFPWRVLSFEDFLANAAGGILVSIGVALWRYKGGWYDRGRP